MRRWLSPIPGRRWAALIALLAVVLALGIDPVEATDGLMTIAIGESNDADQRAELLALFDAKDDAHVLTVTVENTRQAMEGIFDLSGVDSAYSSTALTCKAPAAGLEVATHNIEVVPPDLYAMALLTGGVEDATLVVAAPDDAPALGMTALSGVFATREQAPCTGEMDEARQRLALEELALTVAIGQALEIPDGVARATALVLGAQQAIIEQGIANPSAIDVVVAEEEAAADIRIPAAQRSDLVDLLTRLTAREMDWGAYASGWSIQRDPEGGRITLIGTGPVDEPSVTASPPAGVGGMNGSLPSQPAAAPPAAQAPTMTVVGGLVVGQEGGRLLVAEKGREDAPVAYPVDIEADIVRNGVDAALGELRPGDAVHLTVDPTSGRVVRLGAQATARDPGRSFEWLGWTALIGLPLVALVAVVLLARGRRSEAPALAVPSPSGAVALDDRAVLQAVGLVPSKTRKGAPQRSLAVENEADASPARRRLAPVAALLAAGRSRVRAGVTSFRVMRYRFRQRRRAARPQPLSR